MRLFGKRIESFFGGRTSLKAFWNRRMIYCQSNGRDSENSFSTSPLSLSLSLAFSLPHALAHLLSHTLSHASKPHKHTCLLSRVWDTPHRTHPHPRTPKLIKKSQQWWLQSRAVSLICLVSFLLKLLFDFQLWSPEHVWMGYRLEWQFCHVPLYILNLILYTLSLQ